MSGPWFIKGHRLEFCMPHLMVTITDQLVGVMNMQSICKSLEEPGKRDHLFCVPQDCGLRCLFSLNNIST